MPSVWDWSRAIGGRMVGGMVLAPPRELRILRHQPPSGQHHISVYLYSVIGVEYFEALRVYLLGRAFDHLTTTLDDRGICCLHIINVTFQFSLKPFSIGKTSFYE